LTFDGLPHFRDRFSSPATPQRNTPAARLNEAVRHSGCIVGKQEVIGYFLFARYSRAIP